MPGLVPEMNKMLMYLICYRLHYHLILRYEIGHGGPHLLLGGYIRSQLSDIFRSLEKLVDLVVTNWMHVPFVPHSWRE